MTVDRIQMEIAIKHDKARQEIADIAVRRQVLQHTVGNLLLFLGKHIIRI